MNLKSAKILTTLILSGMFFIGCGGGGDSGTTTPASTDTTAPVFSSATAANDLLEGNFTTSTVVYDATADNDVNVTYTLASGIGSNDLFNIASDGNVTFKALPTVNSTIAHNDYNLTITATDTAHNHTDHNVTLRIMNDIIDLGTYGNLIAPVHVNGNWYYYWDRSGDGTSANTGSLNGGVDSTTHDVLDGLFNHDINGTVNTTVANYDGNYGTTNDYRYATINGVKLALPTTGSGNANETNGYYLSDNGTYTDLAAIWDIYNSGYLTSGAPSAWQASYYWSATPDTNGHSGVALSVGYLYNDIQDVINGFVALQVR